MIASLTIGAGWFISTVVTAGLYLQFLKKEKPITWPKILLVHSALQLLNAILIVFSHNNELPWIEQYIPLALVQLLSFLRIIGFILKQALWYVILQLAARHWPIARRQLRKIEWRSIMGLSTFIALADLIFIEVEADTEAFAEFLPPLILHISILLLCLVLSLLHAIRINRHHSLLKKSSNEGEMERKAKTVSQYCRYYNVLIALLLTSILSLMVGPILLKEIVLIKETIEPSIQLTIQLFLTLEHFFNE